MHLHRVAGARPSPHYVTLNCLAAQLFAVGEALLCTLTKRGRRIGDYLSDTLVIEEQPDRQERLRDYSDYWMKRDSETDWRKLPTDIAEAMERAKMRRAKEREAEQL